MFYGISMILSQRQAVFALGICGAVAKVVALSQYDFSIAKVAQARKHGVGRFFKLPRRLAARGLTLLAPYYIIR